MKKRNMCIVLSVLLADFSVAYALEADSSPSDLLSELVPDAKVVSLCADVYHSSGGFSKQKLQFDLITGHGILEEIQTQSSSSGEFVPSWVQIESWNGERFERWTKKIASQEEADSGVYADPGFASVFGDNLLGIPVMFKAWFYPHILAISSRPRPLLSKAERYTVVTNSINGTGFLKLVDKDIVEITLSPDQDEIVKVDFLYRNAKDSNPYPMIQLVLKDYREFGNVSLPMTIKAACYFESGTEKFHSIYIIDGKSVKLTNSIDEFPSMSSRGTRVTDNISNRTYDSFGSGIIDARDAKIGNVLDQLIRKSKAKKRQQDE